MHSRRIRFMKTFLALFILLLVTGCSQEKSFMKGLKGTDRVVVSNKIDGLAFAVTGNEVDKIIKALAAGQRADGLTAAVGFELQFFKNDQRLETVLASEVGAFGVRGVIYRDDTGTIKALSERFGATNAPMSLP